METFRKYFLLMVVLCWAVSAYALEPLKESGYQNSAKPSKYVSSSGKQLLEIVYKQVEGQNLYLDFYFPNEDTSTQKPVVIYTHGGGWAAGSKNSAGHGSFNVVHQALLKEGFCVAAVQYRLTKKDTGVAMRDCVIDAKDAIRFLSAHSESLGIDPHRIYTFGDSAGGHLAQMLLFTPPDSFTGDSELAKYTYKTVAGVSWYGPCDFEDEQLFNHDDRANFRDRFGPRIMGSETGPQTKEARYHEMSPVNYLTTDSPALLMIQGDGDTTIPVKQAYRMQAALESIPAPVEITIVKNAGHNWRMGDGKTAIKPSRDEIIELTVQFFRDHL